MNRTLQSVRNTIKVKPTYTLPVYPTFNAKQKQPFVPPTTHSKTTIDALQSLANSKSFYAIAEIKSKPFHVAVSDIIITMRMNDLAIGDVIQLDRVREIGSEKGSLVGNPYILPAYFNMKAVVLEHTQAKPITRRHWKVSGDDKYVTNQSHHTVLRIVDISINTSQ
ncbi:hypothetical protein HDV02_003224 [Globomyces sp. JEL0801]|nr:hypothetical protein HDV02_003224 [Globomyces sp. JEL0801]